MLLSIAFGLFAAACGGSDTAEQAEERRLVLIDAQSTPIEVFRRDTTNVLRGVVSSSSGDPLPGARVSIFDCNEIASETWRSISEWPEVSPESVATTSVHGRIEVEGLSYGMKSIVVEASGYKTVANAQVIVADGYGVSWHGVIMEPCESESSIVVEMPDSLREDAGVLLLPSFWTQSPTVLPVEAGRVGIPRSWFGARRFVWTVVGGRPWRVDVTGTAEETAEPLELESVQALRAGQGLGFEWGKEGLEVPSGSEVPGLAVVTMPPGFREQLTGFGQDDPFPWINVVGALFAADSSRTDLALGARIRTRRPYQAFVVRSDSGEWAGGWTGWNRCAVVPCKSVPFAVWSFDQHGILTYPLGGFPLGASAPRWPAGFSVLQERGTPGGSIYGLVTDGSGVPLEAAQVFIQGPRARFPSSVDVDDEGFYCVSGLSNGRHLLFASWGDYLGERMELVDVIVDTQGGEPDVREDLLLRHGKIIVDVRLEVGAGGAVRLRSAGNGDVVISRGLDSGNPLEFTNLPAGNYELEFVVEETVVDVANVSLAEGGSERVHIGR